MVETWLHRFVSRQMRSRKKGAVPVKQGVNIKELGEQEVYGLWKASSDRAIAKDIGPLSAQFRKVLGEHRYTRGTLYGKF